MMFRSMSILFTVKSSRPENTPLNSVILVNGSLTNMTSLWVARLLADEIGRRRPARILAIGKVHGLLR